MNLPSKVCLTGDKEFRPSDELLDRLGEEITDFLSDKYGFCVNSYDWELTVSNIDWDTTE